MKNCSNKSPHESLINEVNEKNQKVNYRELKQKEILIKPWWKEKDDDVKLKNRRKEFKRSLLKKFKETKKALKSKILVDFSGESLKQ